MNWKSYAIIGGIVFIAVIAGIKMIKFEGTSTEATAQVPAKVTLKPVLTTQKEG